MYVLLCWLKLFHRMVINLARDIDGQRLIPAALYDLSRFPPTDAVAGYMCPETSETYCLSDDDLTRLVKGREHALRFLSAFIVNLLRLVSIKPLLKQLPSRISMNTAFATVSRTHFTHFQIPS
jgi:hypothetical protein